MASLQAFANSKINNSMPPAREQPERMKNSTANDRVLMFEAYRQENPVSCHGRGGRAAGGAIGWPRPLDVFTKPVHEITQGLMSTATRSEMPEFLNVRIGTSRTAGENLVIS